MDELKNFIAGSGLAAEDQSLWDRIFTVMGGEDLFGLAEFIGQDKEKLEFLTNNLRQKMSALANLDQSAMERILEEEKALILNNHE